MKMTAKPPKDHNPSHLGLNKIFAAILIAGIVALASGFAAKLLLPYYRMHGNMHESMRGKTAYSLDRPEVSPPTAAAAQPQASIAELLATADPEVAGKKAAARCVSCHNFKEGGPNQVGPALWDVVDRAIATEEGFSYSNVLIAKGENGETWSYENLDAFIAAPKTWAPKTKMNFAGISKAKKRADLIAYLRGLSHQPAPLP